MDHHGHLHAIERAEPYELLLAREELNPPFPPEIQPILHIHELLGGHGHQFDVAAEGAPDFGHHEAGSNSDHDADLGVVAAGVGRPGHWVGGQVAGQGQSVELAKNGDRRAVVAATQRAMLRR